MGYVLILLGLSVLGVGLTALIQGHLGWARIPSRNTALVTAMVGVGVLGVGGALTPKPRPGTAATTTARSAQSATSTTATTAPTTTAKPSSKTPAAGGGNTVPHAAPGRSGSSVWDTLAQCESGGNWAINTGNGSYGGVQLDRRTWLSNGGRAYAPLPSKATREQQILIAEKVRADRGFSPWSSCARKLGLL